MTGLGGRFSLDLLRALVCHQGHKLTTYSFGQAVEAVLGGEGGEEADAIEGVDIVEVNEAEAAASAEAEAEAELILPSVLAAAPTARVARHLAAQGRLLHRLAHKLKTLEETIEMARITGLPLRTIANQAQMVRTENLLLKAARSQGYVLPLSAGITPVPTALRWTSSEMVFRHEGVQSLAVSGPASNPRAELMMRPTCAHTMPPHHFPRILSQATDLLAPLAFAPR